MQHLVSCAVRPATWWPLLGLLLLGLAVEGSPSVAWAGKRSVPSKPSPAAQAAIQYANAIGKGDIDRFVALDFTCLYERQGNAPATPPSSTAGPGGCWERLNEVHAEAILTKDAGIYAQWPGRGRTVFFSRPLEEYPASAFVMDLIGQSPPGSGFDVQLEEERALPQGSFPSADRRRTLSVPTTVVRLKISYKDPLSAPLAYAPGTFQWTSTVERPRIAVRSVSVQFVVFSGLRRHGFPTDVAVLNLPVSAVGLTDAGLQQAVPFVTESSRAIEQSLVGWQPADVPGLLIAAVARSQHFPELEDRVGMLNRVLLIDPLQPEALTTLYRDLYLRLLATGDAAPPALTRDPSMARRLAELSWNEYAQTTRTDLSLNMEVGGFDKPTAADFLYRMIPAMEKLAKVRPMDLDNRLYLGIAYRWNNDQVQAIHTHEQLYKDLAGARGDQRARALNELAWSRISKVAWNRQLDDPDIAQAYREAEEAFKLTSDPLEKFIAAYTMAYSQVFMPQRDPRLMLANLTEAKRWFDQTAGASPAAWQFALGRETLKAVLDADPTFRPLVAASEDKQG